MRAPYPTNNPGQNPKAMAAFDSNILKLASDATTPAYRTAPHNIEAERGLLGAILVNNDAFYRVSDFLEPKHFFAPDPPDHLRDRRQPDPRRQDRNARYAKDLRSRRHRYRRHDRKSVPRPSGRGSHHDHQRLDYGRTIYEQALRRDLIHIGEDMVNVAYDAPVDFAPRAQIEDAERRLYELAESGRYDGGFQKFSQAMKIALDMAANAYRRDGKLSGIATGLRDLDSKMGGLQQSDLIIVAGRPGMGKTALATNIAYNIAKTHQSELQPDGTMKTVNGGIVGFFSCEMSAEQLATRILAEQTCIRLEQYSARRHH